MLVKPNVTINYTEKKQFISQSSIVQVLHVFSTRRHFAGQGVTLRCFKCTQFRQGILDFNLEFVQVLQIDFSKQRYKTLNATIPGPDRIFPKTQVCTTFFDEYI